MYFEHDSVSFVEEKGGSLWEEVFPPASVVIGMRNGPLTTQFMRSQMVLSGICYEFVN